MKFDAQLLMLFILITVSAYQFNEHKLAKNLELDTRRLTISNGYDNSYGSLQGKCYETALRFFLNKFPGNIN